MDLSLMLNLAGIVVYLLALVACCFALFILICVTTYFCGRFVLSKINIISIAPEVRKTEIALTAICAALGLLAFSWCCFIALIGWLVVG